MTARLDDLTGLPLRGGFTDAAAAAIEVARARSEPVSLLVIDVDGFQHLNDTYGRLHGDDVLVEVAEIVRRNLRAGDFAARLGDDDFAALLPNTPAERAREVAERIGAAVRGHAFVQRGGGGHVPVTASQGVATYPEHGTDGEALLVAAGGALHRVKRNGRDGAAVAGRADAEPGHLPLSIDRFVGRAEEVRTLVHLLEDAAAGRPRVVAITGEAGVGKTTLIRQLEPEVRLRAGSLVTGRCRETAVPSPYGPWAQIVAALERVDRPPPGPWRELPRLAPVVSVESGAESRGGSRFVLLDEIAEYLRRAAAVRPLVVVLDDMQWADAATWDALESLVPQLDVERTLICLTLRTEEAYGEPLERWQRLSRSSLVREISLARLTREGLKQWTEAAFHRQDVGRELLAFLYRQTGGNPLFVVQVLHTLLEEGAVWHTGERWEWRAVSELRLPIGIRELIARRLTRLSPATHALLTTAAVVGREFDLDLVTEAAEETEDELLDAIDEGARAALVRGAPERGAERYAFAHVLLADALCAAATPRQLRKAHEQVARALERRVGSEPALAHAEIADHYDRAEDAPSAYRCALLAAAAASGVDARQAAADVLRVAERSAASPAELAHVRVRLAEAAEALGRYDEAEELCDLAIDWFAGHGERRQALNLRRMRERLRALLGQPARRTLEACQALGAEARALGADSERVALLAMISHTHERLGERRAAELAARQCVTLAERLGDPVHLAEAVNRLGATVEGDSLDAAAECYRRALALYEEAGDARGQANCHNNLGIVQARRGEWSAARQALQRAIALSRRAGTPDLRGLCSLNLGVVELKGGDYDRARELLGEALALFAEVKNTEMQLHALYNLAHLDRERGELAAAAELYDVAASLARRIEQADVEAGAVAGAGLARLRQGQLDAARTAHREAEARAATRAEWFQGRELIEALAIHMAGAAGDLAAAAERFEQARALAEGKDFYAAVWLASECGDVLRDPGRGVDDGDAS